MSLGVNTEWQKQFKLLQEFYNMKVILQIRFKNKTIIISGIL